MKWITLKTVFYLGAMASICSFWFFYGVVSYFNRFANDDYSLIMLGNHRGIINGSIWLYMNWSGRLSATLFQTAILHIIQNDKSLLVFSLFLLTFLSISLFFILHQLSLLWKLNISKICITVASQFLIQGFFFSSFSISQNWFWVTGSLVYLAAIGIAFLSLGHWFRFKRKNKQFDFLLCLFWAVIFASFSVNITFVFLIAIIFMLGYHYIKSREISVALLMYLLFTAAGMLVAIVAPGNAIRMKAEYSAVKQHPSFMHEMIFVPLIIIKNIVFTKLLYLFVFCVPAVYFFIASGNLDINRVKKEAKLLTLFLFALFVIAIYSNTAILYKVFGFGLGEADIAEYRSLLHVSVLSVFVVFLSLLLFLRAPVKADYAGVLSCVFMVVGIFIFGKTTYYQYPVLKQYARAHDARVKTILDAKAASYKGILYLDPLPPSGMLLTAEMSTDTSFYLNGDMKKRFDLPFCLAVK